MSCLGTQGSVSSDEREPLLAQYDDETSLQRTVHQKMHSYQMIRALLKGYLPSTMQIIINLRTLLTSDLLNPDTCGLSSSGKELVKSCREWINVFIKLLKNKNDEDRIQEFIYFIARSELSVDTDHVVQTMSKTKIKAKTSAVYNSVETIGKLLLTNAEFRKFLRDLNIIGRQIFAETSHVASKTVEVAAEQIERSTEAMENMESAKTTDKSDIPKKDTEPEFQKLSTVFTNAAKETTTGFHSSVENNFSGDQMKVLAYRLRSSVTKLRMRSDYSESVSILSLLIKKYAQIYFQALDKTINTVQGEINTNRSLELATQNAWHFISSFGDRNVWVELKNRFDKVIEHTSKDFEINQLCEELSKTIKQIFTDPDFFASANEKFDTLKNKSQDAGTENSLGNDINKFLAQIRTAFNSMINDECVSQLLETTHKILLSINPSEYSVNSELLADTYNIVIPNMIRAIHYIPIPRIEISVPEMDLLVENLLLEPGHTVNQTSFLPFQLKIQSFNDFTMHKARFGTVSSIVSIVTVKLKGLTLRADEVGFWLRIHKSFLRFSDEGIASIIMDERGMDIELDIEIGRDRLENILTLKDSRVKIHKFSYNLRRSKFSCLAWLLKPFIRHFLCSVFERNLAKAIGETFHSINRELLYARERLRATRISNPQDLRTFVEAVVTRLKPKDNPDFHANIGVRGALEERGNVFSGRYTPGSIVKLWDDQALQAGDIVDQNSRQQTWKNSIFDVQAQRV